MNGKRGRGGVGAVLDGVTGVYQGASGRLRDIGTTAGSAALRAAEGVSAAAGSTTATTRRAARSTRRTGRSAGLEARRRAVGIASAARGDRPPARWPVALGALGVGVGVGMAAGVAASRAMRGRDDDGVRAEDSPASPGVEQPNGSHPQSRVTSAANGAPTAQEMDTQRSW